MYTNGTYVRKSLWLVLPHVSLEGYALGSTNPANSAPKSQIMSTNTIAVRSTWLHTFMLGSPSG